MHPLGDARDILGIKCMLFNIVIKGIFCSMQKIPYNITMDIGYADIKVSTLYIVLSYSLLSFALGLPLDMVGVNTF